MQFQQPRSLGDIKALPISSGRDCEFQDRISIKPSDTTSSDQVKTSPYRKTISDIACEQKVNKIVKLKKALFILQFPFFSFPSSIILFRSSSRSHSNLPIIRNTS